MAVTVMIPAPLRKFADGAAETSADGATVGDVVQQLAAQYTELAERVVDENGNIRRFINVFVNDEDIRFLDGAATELRDGDVVSLVPAVAGGARRG